MKFGGTSVANIDRLTAVAAKVKAEVLRGNKVAVVVSAMSGVTNDLVALANEAGSSYDTNEYDAVVATGEQATSGLLSLCLQKIGVPARSWQGWQIPILTDENHGKARIIDIDTSELKASLLSNIVCVIAGFQGLSPQKRITTLGRGGSDTTAVALAAALSASRCDIYTDVDGVYTSDPRIVTRAKKLDKITYEEMLEMASLGAKVLQTRSVELAMNNRVPLQVLSSFNEGVGSDLLGTQVVAEEEIVEQEIVSGVTYSRDEAKITLLQVPDRPGVAAAIFGPLSDANVNVDMIVQNISENGSATDLTFTVPRSELAKALEVLEACKNDLGFIASVSDDNVVKLSVVGVGMRSHAGVANRMFATLAEHNINILVISTSEIKISVLVAEEFTELALRALHTAYGLDAS
ncbi:MAG: aspartate kinase [Rhodospirillaceae bacterium]|nr:aspartate kinase [Rhodospirillaceae bacterium]|tara:strand:- start:804 stop:2024 length:1221 start_codon:yes stop_codon:yes gene_type:complete